MADETALESALSQTIAETEEVALPILRDRLLELRKEPGDDLSDRLLVDLRHSGIGQTTRVMEAIETLQSVVNGLRENRFGVKHPASRWTLIIPDGGQTFDADLFDEEWQWMSSYATWQAALNTYLYPENSLLPTLAPEVIKSAELQGLLSDLNKTSILDPISATNKVKTFEDAVKAKDPDLISIKLSDSLSNSELLSRRNAIKGISDKPNLRAKAFIVPMLVGLQLQHSGYYAAALGWFENVYAMKLPTELRKIDIKLANEVNAAPKIYPLPPHWTRDLDPYTIAQGRPNPFTLHPDHHCPLSGRVRRLAICNGYQRERCRSAFSLSSSQGHPLLA